VAVVDAQQAAAVLLSASQRMADMLPAGWSRRQGDVGAWVTTAAYPTMNGVTVATTAPAPEIVSELLDEVAAAGLPHCLLARPEAAGTLERVAAAHGLAGAAYDVPLMAVEAERLSTGPEPPGLTLRSLAPDEVERHIEVAAAGFQMSPEPVRTVMTPETLAQPGARCYLAEVDGEPVGTGFGLRSDGSVGIFNITVLPPYLGRGYGAAITAHTARDAFADGAAWAWLQSTPAGFSLYERLGFETVEYWRCWLSV
jgi:N-acetylglutamate synthase